MAATGCATDPVNAFGGSSTHINTSMSRPYSDEISAATNNRFGAICASASLTTIAPRRTLSVWKTPRFRIGLRAHHNYRRPTNHESHYEPAADALQFSALRPQQIRRIQLCRHQRSAAQRQLVSRCRIHCGQTPLPQMAGPRRLYHPASEGRVWPRLLRPGHRDNFTDPNNNINRNNNYLNLDSTYVFKIDGTYELPWKIGTSVNFQHYTGFPLQPTETFNVPEGSMMRLTSSAYQ